MKIKVFWGFAILFLGGALTLQGCSKSTTDASTSTSRKYAGAGSDWRFTLNADGTFTGTESESSSTISGTYTTTSTGFQRLVVTSSTGAHAPAANTVIPCTEVPGFAFVCAPVLDTEDQLVGTLVTGTCPTADFTVNVINMQFNLSTVDMTKTTGGFNQGGGSYDGDLFGTFKWDAAAGTGTGLTHYVVAGYTQLFPTSPGITGTCTNGIMTTTSFNAYLSPAAVVVKVTEAGSPNLGNTIFAMPIQTLGSLSAVNGTYAGFLFDADAATKIHPVTATVSGGSLSVSSVSNSDLVTADGAASGTATLTAVDSPSAGFIKGTVSGHNVICTAGTNVASSGKNVMFCLGQSPSTPAKPYMIVLGSK